jgi:hypothetical protein
VTFREQETDHIAHDISHDVQIASPGEVLWVGAAPDPTLENGSLPTGEWGRIGQAESGPTTWEFAEAAADEPLSVEDRRARELKRHIPRLGETRLFHKREGRVIAIDLEHRRIQFLTGGEMVDVAFDDPES